MSRKDYRLIAQALAPAAQAAQSDFCRSGQQVFDLVMAELMCMLQDENPHFDADRFHAAVYGHDSRF
jgi:hypothetical protein